MLYNFLLISIKEFAHYYMEDSNQTNKHQVDERNQNQCRACFFVYTRHGKKSEFEITFLFC